MASEALGTTYVLTSAGANTLAEMVASGSAPTSSAAFSSHLRMGDTDRLSSLEKLVSAHNARKR